MASADSIASWHPALRPNSEVDAGPSRPPVDNKPPTESPISEPSLDIVDKDDPSEQHVDAWFSEDTTEDASWLAEAPPVTSGDEAATQPAEAVEAAAPSTTETASDHPVCAPVESEAHASNEATSPEELDWAGVEAEEGGEWFRDSKDDIDPFKFMPPSDRTNSFPSVPPLEPTTSSHTRSLSRSQAQDMMAGYEAGEDGAFATREAGPEDDTLATRFEEGMPLLAQQEQQPVDAPKEVSTNLVGDAFADEEDDFFSHIRDSTGPEIASDSPPWALERKSTTQAMGVGNMMSSTQAPDLADTLEDDEEAGAADVVPIQEEEQQGESAVVSSAAPGLTDEMPEVPKADDEDALAAKWSEAFADDDLEEELLMDDGVPESKEMDPAAFFGSDDEGFLEDLDEQPLSAAEPSYFPAMGPVATEPVATEPVATDSPTSAHGRYTPQTQPTASHPQFTAATPPYGAPPPVAAYHPPFTAQPPVPAPFGTTYGAPPPQRPALPKAQSFADKAKGGYTSPYDLPMEVMKPRKRASMQHLPKSSAINGQSLAGQPPPRSASMYHQGPPSSADGNGPVASEGQKPLMQPPKPKEAFFEDLPMTARPRPSPRPSRTSSPALGFPQTGPPSGPPSLHHPSMQGSLVAPPPTAAYQPAPAQAPATGPGPGLAPSPDMVRSTSGGAHPLVQPERAHPYAPIPAQAQPAFPASAPVNAYVPSPAQHAQANGDVLPASNRYSPAPTAPKQPSSNYAPMPSSAPPPPVLPHQPRTSSPLAHFETTAHRSSSQPIAMNGESHLDRRTSLPHELRFNRVPSLPPTREVDEEYEQIPPQTSHSAGFQSYTAGSRYSPAPPSGHRHTPPPLAYAPGQATLSPPKRSPPKRSPQGPLPYQPVAPGGHEFAPPPRSYSQSPGSMQRSANGPYAPTAEPIRRPSSVHTPTTASPSQGPAVTYMSSHRARAPSLSLNMIPPTDGRENDPLQRWKGAPLVSWGLGGTILTSFPKNVPRYGINQTAPMIIRTPGEIKVDHVKDLVPLEDRLAKFPGPLKGKSKKKETVAWLSAGIESLTNGILDPTFAQSPSLGDKRAAERILLWKILRIFVENDGALEGSAAVQMAVRDVLVPGLDEQNQEGVASLNVGSVAGSLNEQSATGMRADAVDPAGIELIRKCLMVGDREKAVWTAVDKRLWGHAMLIANSVSPDLYKQVAQEFVRKEVNYPGYSNESVAALYKVLSGSHEDCVDELVPVHARAGLQLMSTTATGAPSKDALGGLDNWRETLCLILSNRSLDDARALIALGELLSSYGRAEAAHLCFIFARQLSVFGGQDDPRSHFVLIGADHKSQGDHLFKDTEALLLSEVYEYGMSLAGGANATAPHLAAYKLQLAATLAEHGQQNKALEYCAAIDSAVHAQTKRSPYFSPALEHAVHELIGRLKQAPREESSSWIPKPSMNKVSDTMWSTFNKFVSGDDNDKSDGVTNGESGAESGPFARVAGGTPNISRAPSAADLSIYGANNISYPGQAATGAPAPSYPAAPAQPASVSASRYAPSPQHAAVPSNPYEAASSPYTPRSSGELGRNPNPYDSSRPSTGYQQQQYNPAPPSQSTSQPTPPGAAAGYGMAPEASHPAQAQALSYQPQAPATPPGSGYTPLGVQASPYAPTASNGPPAPANIPGHSPSQGYQAPSYGFEPPSMTPALEEPPAAEDSAGQQDASSGGYEPPSYQSYGYEPPSYEPDAEPSAEDGNAPPKPKKSFMNDEDDIPAMNSQGGKTKADKDRENEEMIRRVAEQEAKQAAEKGGKKGWGFGSWFGGSKKETLEPANKPVKANLGEQSSFVYDPDLKRWINKKGGAETTEAKTATAPPPRAGPPRSTTSTPPPPMSTPPQGIGRSSAPPLGPPQAAGAAPPMPLLPPGVSPSMARSVSNQSMGPPSGPPSRPTTSMSNASSIDDLLSAAGPRKPGQKKARKTGRYIDVMAK